MSNPITLESESAHITEPSYNKKDIKPGIVHIGPSHFARAHLLEYVDDILASGDHRWGVRAISLKSAGVRDALTEQGYDYSVIKRSASEPEQTRVIGSLLDVTVAQEDPQKVLEVLCDPQIKLVTLTVTQKGYYHDAAGQTLDFDAADVQDCLKNMDEPTTTIGYLVAALEKRMKAGAPPLTIMSCDNMPSNGTVTRNVVLAYAAQRSPELRRYIEDNIKFPTTMVDRIVPSTQQSDIFERAAKGINDAWPIMTETFKQWVIEDNFASDMPDFAAAGAIVTDTVEPYELMKLRMLNGAHMALGCVARLAGHKFVDKAMQDPQIEDFANNFIQQAAGTVPAVYGVDLDDYRESLLDRLRNPHMKDELARLARNGTQGKVRPRIFDTARDAIAEQGNYQHLAFAAAAWVQYLKGSNDAGDAIDINDPAAVESGLQDIAKGSNGNPSPVLSASQCVPQDLMKNQAFIECVTRHLKNIQERGVLQAIQQIERPKLGIVPAGQRHNHG